MVRIIAGTLRDTGSGKLNPGALKRAIESGDRLDLGVTAPAHGLTLMEVFYALPESARAKKSPCVPATVPAGR